MVLPHRGGAGGAMGPCQVLGPEGKCLPGGVGGVGVAEGPGRLPGELSEQGAEKSQFEFKAGRKDTN